MLPTSNQPIFWCRAGASRTKSPSIKTRQYKQENTPSQPQVTSRPLQLRCSNQPIGLRSSFHFIQRWNTDLNRIGLQNLSSNQAIRAEGGSSCQTWRTRQAVKRIASTNAANDIKLPRAMPRKKSTLRAGPRLLSSRPQHPPESDASRKPPAKASDTNQSPPVAPVVKRASPAATKQNCTRKD